MRVEQSENQKNPELLRRSQDTDTTARYQEHVECPDFQGRMPRQTRRRSSSARKCNQNPSRTIKRRDPGDCLFLVRLARACGLAALVSGKVFWLVMGSDHFQTQKKKCQVRAERVLADAITTDGRREWTCKFCSETNVWTRWRWRRCGNNVPSVLQGKHKQTMYAQNREWYSGSSSSSGREEWKSQEQEEIKRLRAQVELLSRQQGAVKSPEEPGEPARRGRWNLEEGCKMEFDRGDKLEEQKKSLRRQLREIEKFANMDPAFRNKQKEVWKEELEEIERKRAELLLEHQKMKKKSQKLQSL